MNSGNQHDHQKNKHQTDHSGINTGLTRLNFATGGWKGGDLIILASRPGMGKTAMMLFFAKTAAAAGYPVCIYSLELSDIALTRRLILSGSDISEDTFDSRKMSWLEWQAFTREIQNIANLPIHIDDSPEVSMNYIWAESKVMKMKGKCAMIFVDYLQLIDCGPDQKDRTGERRRYAEAARQAKLISKNLKVPLILLSQLPRNPGQREDKKPLLSDLGIYGAIERAADVVAFLYRPAYYGIITDASGKSLEGYGEIIIAKNRDGGIHNVPFCHNKSMTKIFDYNP